MTTTGSAVADNIRITVVPADDRLLVEPLREGKVSQIIWTPDPQYKDRPQQGRIVAVGANIADEWPQYAVGTQVIWPKSSGHIVQFGKRGQLEYVILKPSDILCSFVTENFDTDEVR